MVIFAVFGNEKEHNCVIYSEKCKLTFPEFPALHSTFDFSFVSYHLCTLGFYFASNVVKLMFMELF